MEYRLAYLSELPKVKSLLEKAIRSNYIITQKKFCQWQYLDTPHSTLLREHEIPFSICIDQGRVLSVMAFIPSLVEHNKKSYTCFQLTDWYSDPDVRGGHGLGVLTYLIERADILLAFGMNELAKRIYLSKRFSMNLFDRGCLVHDLESLELMMNVTFSNEEKSLLKSKSSGAKPLFKKSFPSELFLSHHAPSLTPKRSLDHLQWRYGESHPHHYEPYVLMDGSQEVGLLVCHIEKVKGLNITVFRICEWMCDSEYDPKMTQLVNELSAVHHAVFSDFFTPHRALISRLTQQGFRFLNEIDYLNIPRLFQPLEHRERSSINLGLYVRPEFRDREINDLSNWYLTKGDGNQDRPNDDGYVVTDSH